MSWFALSTRRSPPARELFARQIGRASILAGNQLEKTLGDEFAGAVVHHGRLRSCGLAKTPVEGNVVLVISTCWLPDRLGLSTPGDILLELDRTTHGEQPLLRGRSYSAIFGTGDGAVLVENDPFGFYLV